MASSIGLGILADMSTSTQDKVRENRLRRMAERQGLALQKNRRRDPYAADYGLFWLRRLDDPMPEQSHDAWIGYPAGFTMDEVEAYLKADPKTRDDQ
jgi:hypothetical protein